MNHYDTELALATFRSGVADPDLFLVKGWKGSEGISQLYRFEIELASAQDNIDLNSLLGSRATFTLRNEYGVVMPWHGLITELHQTYRDETYAYYRAVLEPQLALLRLFKQSRVYVNADTVGGGSPDLATVIRTTLKQCGLVNQSAEELADFDIRISQKDIDETQSNFICQFEETTLNFLLRRLEQAGVYFWFDQSGDNETVIFASQLAQQPQGQKVMVWRPAKGIQADEAVIGVQRFEHSLVVQPKGVVLREFSVSQPNLSLTVEAKVSEQASATDRFDAIGNIEVYGAHYNKQAKGLHLAKLRAEQIACQRNHYLAETHSIGLSSGMRVHLAQHFRTDFNRDYYVITMTHQGKQSLPRQATEYTEEGFYQASFTVLPADQQFRPAFRAQQPRVVGFVSALIMAEGDGDYAQMNEYGCYKVQFLFAPTQAGQDEANSAWVRMATPYAGSQHGMSLPLLKDTEVLISFLSGNPDRPVIVAAVPNEHNPSLRNEKNASQPVLRTAGQNALEFEDQEGHQYTRLSTPTGNTTFQLGADAQHPEQTGVRIATSAHTGLKSGSYIHQVDGVYKQEIGQEGTVDQDPEPRLALQQLQDKQLAAYLEEIALLPDATPAQQLKALNAKIKSHQSELLMFDLLIEKQLDEKNIDNDLIFLLNNKKENLKSIISRLLGLINLPNGDSAINDYFSLIGDSDESFTILPYDAEKAVKEKTTKEKYKEVGHMGMETTYKKNAIINNFMFGISNSVSFALTNEVYGGMKNEINMAGNLSLIIGGGVNVNLSKSAVYNLMESEEVTAFKKKEKASDKDEIFVNYTMKSAVSYRGIETDVTEAVSKKTNVFGGYDINVIGGMKTTSVSGDEIKIENKSSSIVIGKDKNSFNSGLSKIEVENNKIKASSGPNSKLEVTNNNVKINGRDVQVQADGLVRLG